MDTKLTTRIPFLTVSPRASALAAARRFFVTIWCVAAMIVLFATSSAFAADTFPGPALGVGGSFVDSNVGTTGETGEPLTLGGGALNTQWYSWTAPASGFVSFGTCNPTGSALTNFDTTIGVYTGSAVNALTQIGFNDDTPGCNSVVNANYGSTVAFNAIAGTIYRIQVDGYANATGQFNLFYGYSGYTTAVTGATATEGGTSGAFTIVLNAIPTSTATITLGTSAQCTFSPNPLTFTSANWNVAQTVTVTAIDDLIVEGPHFCAPASITPSGGGVVGSSAPPPTISVTDNDTATVTITNTTNGAEASAVAGVMTITQSKASITNTVIAYTVTGTATSGTDYTALSGTVTILAGQTIATITIPVIDDAIVEGSETVIVTMNSLTATTGVALGAAATRTATNTIADNDTAIVTLANITNGNEQGPVSGVITLTQSATSGAATVIAYSISGTATNGTDYSTLTGSVTIPAGSTTANITIPVIDDAVVEGNETVIITLTSISSGSPGVSLGAAASITATNTIADNDAPIVTIANTTNVSEPGPANGVMTVTMSATRPTSVTLSYSVAGTATSGADFTALSGTVTIASGATTALINIPVLDDLIVEGNETVVITLTAVTSGAASLGAPANLVATNTIGDNDTATISLANTTNGSEIGPANGVLTVTQSKVSTTDTVMAYTVTGTATPTTDYTALSGTITILAGSTTATISFPVVDDLIVEGSETVIVAINSITSGQPTITLSGTVSASNSIADNDAATVSIANITNGAETGPVAGIMRVTQTLASSTPTVLSYTVSGTAVAGAHYTALSGTITIPAGATTADINIAIIDDALINPGETIVVTITAKTSGQAAITLGSPLTATNTITDNDFAAFTISKAVNLANITSPQTLIYTITIVNTGTVAQNAPLITDTLSNGSALTLTSGPTLTSGDAGTIGTLDIGETWIYNATYAVTQANINNGSTINNSSTFKTTEVALLASNTVSTTITITKQLTTVKTANTTGPVPVGTVITYTYKVTNSGNVTMSAVTVADTHNGSGVFVGPSNEIVFTDVAPLADSTDATTNGSWDSLGPGDTLRFTATYTVTQSDVDFLQ